MTNPFETEAEFLRLQALLNAQILDTPAETDFDDLTRLSALICRVPIALVSLVDDKRQWFKSKQGTELCETSRNIAFCAYTIQNPSDLFIVENALEDPRFMNNPLVTEDPFIRFYAGAPIVDSEGYALGSLCVMDYLPRRLNQMQIETLRILSKQVAAQIELRTKSRENEITSNRYRQILEQAADGIYLTDLNGQITGANRKFCEIVGLAETEVLQMNVRDFFAAESFEKLEENVKDVLEGQTTINELCIRRPNQTEIPVELSEKLIDENTRQGIMRDIRQRKKAESELSETRQLFSLFVNNNPTMIFMKDSAGRFVFTNKVFEQTFNVREADVVGKTNTSVISEEISERVRQIDEHVLNTGEITQTVEVVPLADGTLRHWLSHKFLIENRKGEKFIGGVAIDITERHEMEVELKAARDAALESVNLKSAFLANISHELRTPMNGVIGMTELLSNSPLSEAQQEYVDTIHHSAESLLSTINDILDLSKIEAGKMRFEAMDFDVREIVESTAEMFAKRAELKKITINTLIESKIPHFLNGDPVRLRQILVNLIGNAVKFTETGEIEIKVKIEEFADNGAILRFSIADTGIGISSENLKMLFQPFMQVDNSHTRQFGGVGLGLALAKQIIERMNGEIRVESELEKGSTFSFTAQFNNSFSASEASFDKTLQEKISFSKTAQISANDSAQKSIQTADLDESETPKSKFTVLVVEDNEINRRIVLAQLKRAGISADYAADGFEALEKLARLPYQLILMDCQMPRLDGYQATAEIRRIENHKRKDGEQFIPSIVIALTAHTLDGEREKCIAAGMNDYISKPFKSDDLIAVIDQWRNVVQNHSESLTTSSKSFLDNPSAVIDQTAKIEN